MLTFIAQKLRNLRTSRQLSMHEADRRIKECDSRHMLPLWASCENHPQKITQEFLLAASQAFDEPVDGFFDERAASAFFDDPRNASRISERRPNAEMAMAALGTLGISRENLKTKTELKKTLAAQRNASKMPDRVFA